MSEEKRIGTCDGCEKPNRKTTRIESGQWVCRACLREIRPPLASSNEAERMRAHGFNVGEKLTKERLRYLRKVLKAREAGFSVGEKTPESEIDKVMENRPESCTFCIWPIRTEPDSVEEIRCCPLEARIELIHKPSKKNPSPVVARRMIPGSQFSHVMGRVASFGMQKYNEFFLAQYLEAGGEYLAEYGGPCGKRGGFVEVTLYPYRRSVKTKMDARHE